MILLHVHKNNKKKLKPMENTFKDFSDLFEVFDSVFGNAFNCQTLKHKAYSKNDSYLLEFAVPGYEKNEIEVSIEGDIMTLCSKINEKDETFWKTSFVRKFRIPKDADVTNVVAKMDKGILTVEVFKVKKEQTSNSIKID